MFYEVPIIGAMKKADEGVKVRLLTPQLESALEREKEEAKVEKEDILAEIERIKAQIQEKVAEVPGLQADVRVQAVRQIVQIVRIALLVRVQTSACS